MAVIHAFPRCPVYVSLTLNLPALRLLCTISSSDMRSFPFPAIFCVAFDEQIGFKQAFLHITGFRP